MVFNMTIGLKWSGVSLLLAALTMIGSAQAQPTGPNAPPPPAPFAPNPAQIQILNAIRPDYVLGPNDQMTIRAPQAEEINERPFRVDADGFITLPIVGRVRASGLTVQALEVEIVNRLRDYIREPQVVVTVVQFRNEPVFVVGAFRAPGIYPLSGRRTLVELLTTVGGLQPNATRRIKVVRRADYGPLPLSNAVETPDKKLTSVEISLESLTETVNPAEDLVLQAYDIISADRAEKVYVSGEVVKVSGIELGERESISVAQALTEVGGFTQFAVRDKVKVLRPVLGTNRRAEIVIDLKRIFEGKDIDFPLLPNDLLYVPRSGKRAVGINAGNSIVNSIPYIIVTALLR